MIPYEFLHEIVEWYLSLRGSSTLLDRFFGLGSPNEQLFKPTLCLFNRRRAENVLQKCQTAPYAVSPSEIASGYTLGDCSSKANKNARTGGVLMLYFMGLSFLSVLA